MCLSRAIIFGAAMAVTLTQSLGAQAAQFSYCDLPNTRKHMVFVDRTTQFDKADTKYLVDAISAIHDGLQIGDRIIIQTITDDYA